MARPFIRKEGILRRLLARIALSTAPYAQLRFRPMEESDLAEILAIERVAYAFPWSESVFRDCLRVGYSAWVMEWQQRISAYAIMIITTAGESHILNLCVRPEVQGIGLGRAMLEHLIDVARKHNTEVIFLEVRPSNTAAVQLYKRAGFVEVGTRNGYYPAPNGREDALILALQLWNFPAEGNKHN